MAKFSFNGEVLSGKEEFFQKISTALDEGKVVHVKELNGKPKPVKDVFLYSGDNPEEKITIYSSNAHHFCASIRA